MRNVNVKTRSGKFTQTILIGNHELIGDEPESSGGEDLGPSPFEHVLAGLGSCTSMTIKMYSDRKGWPLESVEVTLSAQTAPGLFRIERKIKLAGPSLTEEQKQRLLEVANKCPVHKALTGKIEIQSELESI